MPELKFYILCFLIAAPHCTQGSAPPASSGASFSPAAPGQANPSLRADPVFVNATVSGHYLSLVYSDFWSTYDGAECREQAIAEGAHAFRIGGYHNGCSFYRFYHPICKKFKGNQNLYIREDYYTDGSPSDDASLRPSTKKRLGSSTITDYRIESPTIIDFPEYLRTNGRLSEDIVILPTSGGGKFMDPSILSDPSCYTNNTCGTIFITDTPPIPADELLVLNKICGQTIQVDSGKSFYVLSHEGIGCKFFPNDYPVADCWVEFTGPGEMKTDVTLVDFRGSDQCDGFTMTALTYDVSGSSDSTDLCLAAAPTELTSAGGKVRIEFGGGAGAARQKYGFIIKATLA